MRILWSLPVRGERLGATRGDLVRARHLVDALREDGHDVKVVEDIERPGAAIAVSTYRRFLRCLLPGRAAHVVRDLGRAAHALGHGLAVARAAARHKAELLIETQVGFSASGALAARLTGLPFVLDDCSPSFEESLFGTGLPGLAGFVLAKQAQAATAVIATSRTLREALLQEGIPVEKVCVVPNGVNLEAFGSTRRELMRRNLGLDGRCVIGFVGSFQPWHQAELLIEALARLAEGHPVHLLLVGEGPGLEPALARARALRVESRVTAAGAVPTTDVAEYISAFDIGGLPGTNGYGHPMKLVEYGAAGLPSVAPNLQPVREVVEHEVHGLLFEAGNARALAASLARLVADAPLRLALGRAAQQRAAAACWRERARALVRASV